MGAPDSETTGRTDDHPHTSAGAEALARLAAIVESSHDAILAVDHQANIRTWNVGATHVYGYTAEEALGQHVSLLVHGDRYPELEEALAAASRGEPMTGHEAVHLAKNDVPVDVSVTVSPIRHPSGRVVGASLVCRDVTEQRWIAATLDSTLQTLQRALDASEEAERRSRRVVDGADRLRHALRSIGALTEQLHGVAGEQDREPLMGALSAEVRAAEQALDGLLLLGGAGEA